MFNNKRGVVSLITYTFLLLFLLISFSGFFVFYLDAKSDAENLIRSSENLNALLTFRSELINLLVYENSSLNYSDLYVSEEVEIILSNYSLSGRQVTSSEIIVINVSNLGIDFCGNLSFYPSVGANFVNSGSCVVVS